MGISQTVKFRVIADAQLSRISNYKAPRSFFSQAKIEKSIRKAKYRMRSRKKDKKCSGMDKWIVVWLDSVIRTPGYNTGMLDGEKWRMEIT